MMILGKIEFKSGMSIVFSCPAVANRWWRMETAAMHIRCGQGLASASGIAAKEMVVCRMP
jgi:hypothetical protein